MDTLTAAEFLARSSTLTSVGCIGYLVLGAIAGFIASKSSGARTRASWST